MHNFSFIQFVKLRVGFQSIALHGLKVVLCYKQPNKRIMSKVPNSGFSDDRWKMIDNLDSVTRSQV
jgi:hypothetical protein